MIRTKGQLQQQVATLLASGRSPRISAADGRSIVEDLLDSLAFRAEASVTLTQAQIRDLHNTRVLLVPAAAGSAIVVDHFIFERSAGVAATDQGNSLPRFGVVLAPQAGGQIPSQGAGGYFERVVYGETVSGVITAAAYTYRIGVGTHILVDGVPLVAAMNAGAVTGNPTGTLKITAYYEYV